MTSLTSVGLDNSAFKGKELLDKQQCIENSIHSPILYPFYKSFFFFFLPCMVSSGAVLHYTLWPNVAASVQTAGAD